jgi:hypothetical protein
MAALRHDAKACRQKQTSEQIRLSNGWLTPAERQEQAEREETRRLAAQKKAQAGSPLGLEDPE